MDGGLRQKRGAPTVSSKGALVSKDRDVGYMLQVGCRWDQAPNVVCEDVCCNQNWGIWRFSSTLMV